MGNDLARLALMLIAGAAFVNVTRGTFGSWLHAKFVGTGGGTATIAAPAIVNYTAPGPAGAASVGAAVGSAAASATASNAAAAHHHPDVVARRAPRDLKPQFPNAAAYALAVRLNPDPRHLIPHMDVQEGTAIKYEDVRGGSETDTIAALTKRARGG